MSGFPSADLLRIAGGCGCNFKIQVKNKVKGNGQECPFQTGYSTNRMKPLLEVWEPLVAVTVTL
jgi:hypothetical protein